jgi:general secretion pathway protein G
MRAMRAFTLLEILIVVVILGVLAGIVVPSFSRSVDDASAGATLEQLTRIRKALDYYYAGNLSRFPASIVEGEGTWGELLLDAEGYNYLRDRPKNFWVPGASRQQIVLRDTPDTAYQTAYGWIYDPGTGQVWAGGFDGDDKPFPK